MIQIMIKKLTVITCKFKSPLVAINQGKNEADNLLEEAFVSLTDTKTAQPIKN